MYKRVMAVDVFLWGRHVGKIAPDFGSYYQFQYDADFVRSGIQIAPIVMPLSKALLATMMMESLKERVIKTDLNRSMSENMCCMCLLME